MASGRLFFPLYSQNSLGMRPKNFSNYYDIVYDDDDVDDDDEKKEEEEEGEKNENWIKQIKKNFAFFVFFFPFVVQKRSFVSNTIDPGRRVALGRSAA